MARQVRKVIVHNSDSDRAHHDNMATIDYWHKANGWSGIGYHYFIQSNGNKEYGRPENVMGVHVRGHNSDSIGICLHGKTKFTEAQFSSLVDLIKYLRIKYPDAKVYAHNDLDKGKSCPNFDVHSLLKKHGLD